jgi:hypothetical protein
MDPYLEVVHLPLSLFKIIWVHSQSFLGFLLVTQSLVMVSQNLLVVQSRVNDGGSHQIVVATDILEAIGDGVVVFVERFSV